jgi:hypothetical protein
MRDGFGTEAKRLRVSIRPARDADSAPVSSGEVELPQGLDPGVPRLLYVTLPASGVEATADPDWEPDDIVASLVDAAGKALSLERPLAALVRATLSREDRALAKIGETLWFPLPPAETLIPDDAHITEAVDFEGMGTLVGLLPEWHLSDSGPIGSDTTPAGVAAAREAGQWRFEVVQTPGESTTLPLVLYWRAEGGTTRDLVVSAQLLPPPTAADGRPVAQDDSPPRDPGPPQDRPTSGWRSGEIVADLRTLRLPLLAPGDYTLAVTVYDPGHRGGRIPAATDGSLPDGGAIHDNLVPIATVRIKGAGPAGESGTPQDDEVGAPGQSTPTP